MITGERQLATKENANNYIAPPTYEVLGYLQEASQKNHGITAKVKYVCKTLSELPLNSTQRTYINTLKDAMHT